jgi:hypothetical protein
VHKVVAFVRSPDVVPDHFLDAVAAIWGLDKVIAELGRHHHGKMLMLRDGGDLSVRELSAMQSSRQSISQSIQASETIKLVLCASTKLPRVDADQS